MEFHSLHKVSHPSVLGEEKQQMLNLNRRLETYLSRVKLLEEENALLAKEIQTIRHNSQGDWTRRKCMEEELRQARLEVDAVWRDRVLTELEVGKLSEELQALELQWQREAQAKVKVKTKLEQSRKELEEEQRAQIWLREKVNQLEHELRFLIQTHEEDVAHLEDALIQSKTTVPPIFAQRSHRTPDLLKMGNDFYQKATRAWQEASEAYQGRLAQLEESVDQARNRLAQVGQEKLESQLKLQALEKEMASAQDVRLHLEKAVDLQRDKHCQEIQQLQEHLEDLKVDKEELGQQIDHVLQENHNLMQLKMSLGLEVATYRTLLDGESLRGDVTLFNKPRNISITDAVLHPQVVKKNYQTQLYASQRTTFPSPLRGIRPMAITATPFSSRKPETSNETPKISNEPAVATSEDPYPKIVQDGAVENFRPEEVRERVTYAEPLSPPNEREEPAERSEDKGEEDWNDVDETCEERPADESVVSYQVESGLSSEPCFSDEAGRSTTASLTSLDGRVTEKPSGFSDDLVEEMVLEGVAEREVVHQQQILADAGLEAEYVDKMVEHVQEESESETEAVLEPTFESRPSSLESECEPLESVFNQVTNYNMDENIKNDDAVEIRQELCGSVGETGGMDAGDKLYPDGEEMDTWDSVIERKVEVKTEDIRKEEKKQHAEPEEDISARELEKAKTEVSQDDRVVSSLIFTQADEGQRAASDQQQVPYSDKEDEDDDEEDSQNVSVSWRTELESDSYAQENTLADTRPLIRYKSDETDANTQASHMDESESSEGEHEKKMAGEAGTATWSDGKSKTFGTMEDLCEEVDDETVDEEYNLGYTNVEDRDVSQGTIVSEQEVQRDDSENEAEEVRDSEEESQDLTRLVGRSHVDRDEELEIDRLVEQELENLSTDSYSAHFAQRNINEDVPHLEDESFEEVDEQDEEGKASCEQNEFHEHSSFTTIITQASENQLVSDSSVFPLRDILAAGDVQHKNQEDTEKREEDDGHKGPMMMHAAATESNSGVTDIISRYDIADTDNMEDPNSASLVKEDEKNLQDVAAPPEITELLPKETSTESYMYQVEEAEDFHKIPKSSDTAEWEVLENPMQDFEVRGENEQKYNTPEVADEGTLTHQEKTIKVFPSIVPDEKDIYIVKDATDSSHGLLLSDVKSESWMSTLDSGATYKPDDSCNEAAEQTNQNQGFTDNQVWGSLENPNVVNGNSRVDDSASKALAATKEQEQMHMDVRKVWSRNVVGEELVHSEESEAEADSWSSGEDVEQLECN